MLVDLLHDRLFCTLQNIEKEINTTKCRVIVVIKLIAKDVLNSENKFSCNLYKLLENEKKTFINFKQDLKQRMHQANIYI